jgi:hypothetical protein
MASLQTSEVVVALLSFTIESWKFMKQQSFEKHQNIIKVIIGKMCNNVLTLWNLFNGDN